MKLKKNICTTILCSAISLFSSQTYSEEPLPKYLIPIVILETKEDKKIDTLIISSENTEEKLKVYKNKRPISENLTSINSLTTTRPIGETELRFEDKDKIFEKRIKFLSDSELRKKIEDYYSSKEKETLVIITNKYGYPYEAIISHDGVTYDVRGIERLFGMTRPQFALYYDQKTKMIHRELEMCLRFKTKSELPKPDFGDLIEKRELPKPFFEKKELPKPDFGDLIEKRELPKPFFEKKELPKPFPID